MQRIAIYGAGRIARGYLQVIKALAADGMSIECVGLMVDAQYKTSSIVHGVPVFSGTDLLARDESVNVVIGIGPSAVRHRIAREIENKFGPRFSTLVHPQVMLGDNVTVGRGTVLFPGLLAATDIVIGAHVYTHHHVHIGHDNVIGDFATIAPGAFLGGGVQIGEGADFGLAVTVLPEVRIGRWSRIGAGAVVTRDVPDNATVVGVPARIVSQREPDWQLIA